jgi:GT2 family glycosyltransferase
MNPPPALNVVTVAYGAPDLVARCLTALGDGLPVLVIDNSSSSEVRDIAAAHGSRYVDAGANLGFAAGVNRALVELGPTHGDVLLLNPDARVSSEMLRELQKVMRADGNERVACVSPALARDDGTPERVEWPFPSPQRVWLEAFALGKLWTQPQFVIGAVLLLRSEAVDDVGMFDERFFLYAEETDWQRRASNRGWSALVSRTLVASHTGAGTSSDENLRTAVFHASAERYIRKWYGNVGWQTFRAGVMLGAGLRWAVTGQPAQRDRLVRYKRGPIRCAEPTNR